MTIDLDAFRLRRFVDRLVSLGEVDVHDRPMALANISANFMVFPPDQSKGNVQPIQSQSARPMTASSSAPDSHGNSSVNIVMHCR